MATTGEPIDYHERLVVMSDLETSGNRSEVDVSTLREGCSPTTVRKVSTKHYQIEGELHKDKDVQIIRLLWTPTTPNPSLSPQ